VGSMGGRCNDLNDIIFGIHERPYILLFRPAQYKPPTHMPYIADTHAYRPI
jgi:hypothetical protein